MIKNFYVKHIPNAIVRICTNDNYYVCEECHKIHKRNGEELRLDEDTHIMSNPIWYGSVKLECYQNLTNKVTDMMHNSIFGK